MVAFTIVWAYVACALWMPFAYAKPDISLYFFPPGYFFAMGGFLGLIGELSPRRWSRLWVALALIAVSWEIGIGIYGGHFLGALLGCIFAAATLIASLLARWVALFPRFVRLMGLLGGILCLAWLCTLTILEGQSQEAQVSPNGMLVAYAVKEHGEIRSVRVGPYYSFNGAFGRKVTGQGESFLPDIDSHGEPKIIGYRWQDNNNLYVFAENGSMLRDEAPSALLPIRLTYSASDERRQP